MFGLQQMLTGAVLRTITGVRDVGEILESIVGAFQSQSDDVTIKDDENRTNIWVASTHTMSDQTHLSRLFAPGGVFWRLPSKGDRVLVLRPHHVDGPGMPWVLHSAGGGRDSYPDWLDNDNSGISCPENYHIESINGDVTLQANSGGSPQGPIIRVNSDGSVSITAGEDNLASIDINTDGSIAINSNAPDVSITLNGGELNVARVTDQVQGTAGPYPIVNGLISGPGAANVLA